MVTQITVNKPASFSQAPVLPGNSQYIRKVGLLVQVANGKAIDLSDMRIVFTTQAMDEGVPPLGIIRVYNLKDDTVNQIQNEFQGVSLQAGYQNGAYGQIFNGSIIRARSGRESNIDSFVELMCSDLSGWFDFGFISETLAPGSRLRDQAAAISASAEAQAAKIAFPNQAANAFRAPPGTQDFGSGGTLPRGKVLFGLARERMTDIANSSGGTWSIENGKINVTSLTNYIPGQAIKLNAATGLVGVPESTIAGIELTCLLNPNIKCGRLIQLNNRDITTTRQGILQFPGSQTRSPIGFPQATNLQFFANLASDGFYRAIVVEHEGDSRGRNWYTHVVALAVSKTTSSPGNSVPVFGTQGFTAS